MGEKKIELPLPAAKAISRSQWNGRNGADSGPSRGDPGTRALRPNATFTAAIRNVGFTVDSSRPPCANAT